MCRKRYRRLYRTRQLYGDTICARKVFIKASDRFKLRTPGRQRWGIRIITGRGVRIFVGHGINASRPPGLPLKSEDLLIALIYSIQPPSQKLIPFFLPFKPTPLQNKNKLTPPSTPPPPPPPHDETQPLYSSLAVENIDASTVLMNRDDRLEEIFRGWQRSGQTAEMTVEIICVYTS
jgi:hypothetical protein